MEPPSKPSISVLNPAGAPVSEADVVRVVQHALSRHGRYGEACVLLTGDVEVRELNRRFRSLDAETDVLTFPSGEEDHLGDIAISVPYAARQAALRGVSVDVELLFLAIHGALHLVGFDDEEDRDRLEMVREMNRVAIDVGLPEDREWYSRLHAEVAA